MCNRDRLKWEILSDHLPLVRRWWWCFVVLKCCYVSKGSYMYHVNCHVWVLRYSLNCNVLFLLLACCWYCTIECRFRHYVACDANHPNNPDWVAWSTTWTWCSYSMYVISSYLMASETNLGVAKCAYHVSLVPWEDSSIVIPPPILTAVFQVALLHWFLLPPLPEKKFLGRLALVFTRVTLAS